MTPGVSAELSRHDYDALEKTSGGSVLNREQGWLNGIAVGIGVQGARGGWTLQAGYERGEPHYRGVTQTGIPLNTTTELRVRRLALRWAPPWQARIHAMVLDGYAELAHQRVDRAIQPTAQSLRLREWMDTTWLRSGAMLHVPLNQAWSVHADAQIAWPLQQRLDVDASGLYDPFSLTPRRRISNQISAGLAWHATPQLRVEMWATGDYWRFGPSSPRPISRGGENAGTAAYPGSRQSLHGVRLRLEASF
jgi:hypothetical protein